MLTGALENALNRGLPRSPRAQALCAQLAGKKLAIEVPDVTRVVVESTGDMLHINTTSTAARSSADARPDAEIIGGPLGLLALGGEAPQAVLQRRGVEIRGDAHVAEAFRELGILLRPDLEEALARVVGDVPAHQVGHFTRLAFSWGRRAAATALTNLSEYLAHERRDLVPRNEGDQFLRGVDVLREDVDRLEARLDLLTRA
jgi:ubiquinone biosynthesis accessory factor UbiJ